MRTAGGPLLTPLLLAASCTVSAPADREHYLASIQSGPAEGGAPCLQIRDPALRDECLALAAGRAAEEGHLGPAEAWCQEVSGSAWQAECWFQVAEGTHRWDPEVVALCERSGSYADSCREHLLFTQAALDPSLPDAPGQEAALRRALERAATGLLGPEAEAGRLVDEAVAKRVAARLGPDQPLDPSTCGRLRAYPCALVYVESMRDALRSTDRAPLCSAPITHEAVVGQGFRGWTPEAEALALEVWTQLCRPGRRGASLHLDRGGFEGL